MSAGKGMQPRKGYNWAKYAENYDGIFRRQGTEQPEQPMKTPEQPNPQPILPWHREAAAACFEKTSSPFVQDIITSIARHDPHATTLRLLDGIENDANHGIPFYAYGDNEAACDMAHRLESILSSVRAHLAAHRQTAQAVGGAA